MLARFTKIARRFSLPLDITIVDTSSMMSGNPSAEACRKVVEGFHKHGVIAIRDPRVNESKNQEFLNLMTRYFESRSKKYYSGQKLDDCRPETGYQAGVTPELIERARNHEETIKKHFTKNVVSN